MCQSGQAVTLQVDYYGMWEQYRIQESARVWHAGALTRCDACPVMPATWPPAPPPTRWHNNGKLHTL